MLTRKLTRRITQALTRKATEPGNGGAAFTPDATFFAGRPGFALDFTDASLLFQNINGTGAVSSNDDPIGYVTDLSGNAKHATAAANDTTRPLYKSDVPRGLFDGSNDRLFTPAIDFTGTDKITIVAHMTLLSDALSVPFELSDNAGSTPGGLCVFRSFGVGGDLTPLGYGSGQGFRSKNGYAAPISGTFTFQFDIAGANIAEEIGMRVGGLVVPTFDTGSGALGTGNFGNFAFNIGSRNGAYPANMALRRIVVMGWAPTPEELALLGG